MEETKLKCNEILSDLLKKNLFKYIWKKINNFFGLSILEVYA